MSAERLLLLAAHRGRDAVVALLEFHIVQRQVCRLPASKPDTDVALDVQMMFMLQGNYEWRVIDKRSPGRVCRSLATPPSLVLATHADGRVVVVLVGLGGRILHVRNSAECMRAFLELHVVERHVQLFPRSSPGELALTLSPW